MSKYKAGLHKDVSAIFNGVSLPKGDNAQQSSADAAPGHQGNAPKPSVPEPPPQKLPVSQPPPVQKSSASEPLTQKVPVLQPPVHKPSVTQTPAQELPVSEPPTQKQSASQPSVQKSSVTQSQTAQQPDQKPLVSEPSAPKSPATGSPDQKPSVSQPPAQKSPAPSQATSAKPKTQPQSPQSQPKETPAKQSKANTAAKTAGQAQWQRKLEQIKNKLFTPESGTSPTKQKAMVIAMPVLFIILIVVFIRAFGTSPRKVAGPAKVGQANVAVVSERKVDWQVPKPYPATLRDPMQFGSAGSQAGGAGELIVKGIVYSEDNPTAVIGNQVVHQGDKISDVVITKINENSVEFEANGKKWMQNVQR